MAVDIGPKIGIEGESEYRKQLNNIITQTKTLHAEMRSMESAFDKDTSAKQKAAQQTEVLNKQIDQQKRKVDEVRKAVEYSSEAYGENDSRTLRWRQALANAETELNNLQKRLKEIPNNLQIMGQRMQETGDKISKVGKKMSSVGNTMTKAITAPIAGLGVLAVKTASDFDSQMSKVQAISGATGEEFDDLRSKAREMGRKTKYSASEAGAAFEYMAMAGWKTGDMLDGIEGIMNLAAASGEELATTSDIVTDGLTAFGLSAKDSGHFADVLAAASANANTNVSMLGESFKYAGPVAGALGISIEDTSIALGLMANSGIKASQAGTALRTGLANLTKPTAQMQKYMNKYNVELVENEDGSVDLRKTMINLRKTMGNLSATQQNAAATAIFGKNASAAWLAVINSSDEDFDKLVDSIDNADGVAAAMAATMQDNLAGQLTILKSQIQDLGISFGDILVPQIRKAVEWLQKQVDKFNALDDSTKEQIVKFGMLAAAIGPVLTIGGKLTTGIGNMISTGGKALEWLGKMSSGFGGASSAIGSAAASLGPFLGAVGLAVGAGAALGIAIKALSDKYGGAKSAITEFNEYTLSTVGAAQQARNAIAESTDDLERTTENAQKIMAEAETAAELTDRYAEELYELASKSERTTEEQRRLEAIVSQLDKIYPGFSKAVLDANGNLKVGVGTLKEYIEQLKETARVKALEAVIEEYSEKIVEATKKQIEAEHALEDAEEAAAQASEKRGEVLSTQVSATDRLKAAEERYQSLLRSGTATTEELADAEMEWRDALYAVEHGMLNVNGETVNAADAMGTYADAETTATNEAEALNDEIRNNKKAVDDATKESEKYQKELDDLLDSVGSNTDAMNENADAVAGAGDSAEEAGLQYDEFGNIVSDTGEAIEDATQDIIDAYNKNYESALNSVQGQGKLWQEFASKEAVSAEQIRNNLQSQIQAYSSWNSNVSTLVSSGRYQHDAAFRGMVDSLINAGIDMAPELATIVSLYESGDAELESILSDFGSASTVTSQYADTMATWETIAENGIEAVNKALGEGTKTAGKEASGTAKAISSGYRNGKGDVKSASDELGDAATTGVKAVKDQSSEAESAGKAIGGSISTGVRAQRAEINAAFTSLRSAISTNITAINNLKSTANSAGTGISDSLKSGISSGSSAVTSAITSIKNSIMTELAGVSAKKTDATSAGKGIVDALTSALDGGQSAVQAAGRRLGDSAANGVGGAAGNAQANGRKVIDGAANELKRYEGSQDPWTWGRHLGDNFANGLGSAYANVVAQARQIANAVKNIIGHTTPKEGPMKNDDLWGLHMTQNFAEGMRQGIPVVRRAADDMANTVAAIPTTTVLDIDAVSGRNVADTPLTQYDLMEAVTAAAEQIDWKVVIGNREFSRILRTQGAIA